MERHKDIAWHEAHFSGISSQTTLYGFHKIRKQNNTDKFVVASIDSSFMSVEYHKIGDKVGPLCKHIQFANIPVPGEAEIVSINAFERLPPKRGLVVGICSLVAQAQNPQPKSQALNIYAAVESENELEEDKAKLNRLEIIADNFETLPLSFVPGLLTHTDIKIDSEYPEHVFLLAGTDNKIHVYREKPGSELGLDELPSADFFPEFQDLHTMVLQIEIRKPDAQHRLTAIGFDDGTVKLRLVNISTKETVNQWKHAFYTSVTSVHFFTPEKFVLLPPFLENLPDDASQGSYASQGSLIEEEMASSPVNLLVTSGEQPAVVFRDILRNGLSDILSLPDSDKFDMPTCSLAVDVDFDGQNEVLIGTYGQELLAYKFYPTIEKLMPVYDLSAPTTPSPRGGGGGEGTPTQTTLVHTPTHLGHTPTQTIYTSTPPQTHTPTPPHTLSTPPPPHAPFVHGVTQLSTTNFQRTGARRPLSEAHFEHAEEASKHRHKSDEASSPDKAEQQKRKVKSQDDLLGLINEKGLEPGYVPERKTEDISFPRMELRTLPEPNYRLIWKRSFSYPVMGLHRAEMMGDGLENIVVLTLFGLHILQPDMKGLSSLITSRLQQMCMSRSEEGDEFHKLQTE